MNLVHVGLCALGVAGLGVGLWLALRGKCSCASCASVAQSVESAAKKAEGDAKKADEALKGGEQKVADLLKKDEKKEDKKA